MSFWNKKESGASESASNPTPPTVLSESVQPPSPSSAGGAARVRSALGAGTVVQGKLSFDTSVQIDGKLLGEVYSSRTLVVGKSGSIDAIVNVATLVVEGQISGKISARERVEVRAGGILSGEVSTPNLVVETGGILQATCNMSQPARSDTARELAKPSSLAGVVASA